MKVANYMEVIVLDKIEDTLKGTGVCLCETCKSDIAAVALNNLQPHYFATDKGFLFSKIKTLQLQDMTDVIMQITKAAEVIKQNPRH